MPAYPTHPWAKMGSIWASCFSGPTANISWQVRKIAFHGDLTPQMKLEQPLAWCWIYVGYFICYRERKNCGVRLIPAQVSLKSMR